MARAIEALPVHDGPMTRSRSGSLSRLNYAESPEGSDDVSALMDAEGAALIPPQTEFGYATSQCRHSVILKSLRDDSSAGIPSPKAASIGYGRCF